MQPADTFRFDTVFAITIDQVNREIVSRKSSPARLDFASGDGKETCSGTFGDWQITTGGDGGDICLTLPMQGIVATAPIGSRSVKVTSDKLTATVKVKLAFLDDIIDEPAPSVAPDINTTAPTPTSGKKKKKLKVRATSDDPQNDPVAVVLSVDLTGGNATSSLSFVHPADVLQGTIEDWCNANIGQFAHVIAAVEINDQVDDGAFAFCKPRLTDYAYVNNNSVEDSILGVLCMTTSSQDPAPSIQQISQFAIPPGAKSSFLISQKRMLNDLMLPYFEKVWPGTTADDFQFTEDDLALELIDGRTITLPKVQDGKYSPVMTKLKVSVEVDQLKFESYTTTELSPGITAWCQATHWYFVSLSPGTQNLAFSQAQTPQQTNGVEESQELQDAEFYTELALGIATLLIVVLTAGTASLVAATVLGLAGVAFEAITKGIESGGSDAAPDINMLAYNTTNPIQWMDSQTFTLTSASLNGCLQLGGTLVAANPSS